jgi:tRNA-specific 2-thiouridylase
MSGGVDSSVAAALLVEAGHEVVGATLKLWGGASDSGCCSVGDVEDARRVAEQLGLVHHVFDDTAFFESTVVEPYVAEHAAGRTPNPCIECNRHVKFGLLLERAERLGFDALATGHHARVDYAGCWRLRRGADPAKDQSYVLSMLTQAELSRLLLPVGELAKSEVRAVASRLGLRTAGKPDSQDVCFVAGTAGRRGFLEARMPLHPGTLVDAENGVELGTVGAVELVTVGQRRGLGVDSSGERRYALDVDVARRRVRLGSRDALFTRHVAVKSPTWVGDPVHPGTNLMIQTSAHGDPIPGVWEGEGVRFEQPTLRVAPGQTVALYDASSPDRVVGAALARANFSV